MTVSTVPSVVPPQVDDDFALDAETPPIEALIALSHALDSLGRGAAPDRTVSMPANVAEQLILTLVHYRSLLEAAVGVQIATLQTLQQREAALTAYQNVGQIVCMLINIDCSAKVPQ